VGGAEAKDALVALATVLTPRLGLCTLTSSRPVFKPGASFSLRSRAVVSALPTGTAPPPPPVAASAMAVAWSLAATGPQDDADLIDEDELLAEEDLAKKEANMDCGEGTEGKRKACKNCSCGLRELLENEDANAEAPPPAKSNCGNCALGDAYRCAGCPHRGKPAFVEGSEVKLADAMEVNLAPPAVGLAARGAIGSTVMLSVGDTMDDL